MTSKSSRIAAGLTIIALGLLPATRAGKLNQPATLIEEAPASYRVKFETSKGDFVLTVTREWAPLGADRFYNLVKNGYYDEVRFFRAVPGFVVQFGINGDPALNKAWSTAKIDDDPVEHGNRRGTISFATSGKNSRTTQVFINFKDNRNLDPLGFAAFGKVTEGMAEVVDKLYQGYGERITNKQARIAKEGNAYLQETFPELDYIKKATVLED